MKWLTVCCLVALGLSGCANQSGDDGPVDVQTDACEDWEGVLYLGPDFALQPHVPDAGRTPGNGFAEAFLNNDMDEWVFPARDESYRIVGNLTLTFWTQGNNMPAPIIIGGDPGEGYHFFNQFGTNRGFIESYAIEYATMLPNTDIHEYVEVFQMPVGGLTVEPGDHLRLLLTNLVMDGADGNGPDVLWGGETPSHIQLQTECISDQEWTLLRQKSEPFAVPFHHGLLTGLVPDQEGLNHAIVPFELLAETQRLTIEMTQTGGPNPVKDDMDISVRNSAGDEVWSIGSPYTDEIGTRWQAQLDAHMPPGNYDIRINSYSGHAYEGRIEITQDVRS